MRRVHAIIDQRQARGVAETHLCSEADQEKAGLGAGQAAEAARAEQAVGDQYLGHRLARRGQQGGLIRVGEQCVVDDGRLRPAGELPRLRLAKATSNSITGTSTNTPATEASAAPEFSPNKPVATATASSRKFGVSISAQGAATLGGSFHDHAQA